MSADLQKQAERERSRLEKVATNALARVLELGADHAEIRCSSGESLSISVREQKTESIQEARSSGLSIRAIMGDRVATSSTNDLRPEALEVFLQRVLEMAAISEPDPIAAPPDPSELARRLSKRDLQTFDPMIGSLTVARALKLAKQAEAAALREDERITASDGAGVGRGWGLSVLATSGGFVGSTLASNASLGAHVIADDVEGKKRNGHHSTRARFLEDLDSPEEIGMEAARRAVAQLGSKPMGTGIFPVVFDRLAARGILDLVASCVMGGSVYRKRSYLAERLGTAVASPIVSIIDDPHRRRAPASRLFDGEGRATNRLDVVQEGTLRTFLLDTYSARKLGLAPTASAAGGGSIPHASTSNFYLAAGKGPARNLLRGIDRGLFVARTMGFGFDPVSGNFSRGAQGFLIEKGKLGHPVSEITISRNLDELLQDIDAIASDLIFDGATNSPSFRVRSMTISGS
jgi:PmbA protein